MDNILSLSVQNQFEYIDVDSLNHAEKNHLITLALTVLSRQHTPGELMTSAKETQHFLQLKLGNNKNEEFGILFLDAKNKIIKIESLFFGTIDGASVYPRTVMQKVIEYNAKAVIFYHNHPSGIAQPSAADKAITKRLSDALGIIDVKVLDHFIVGREESYSFAEHGLI